MVGEGPVEVGDRVRRAAGHDLDRPGDRDRVGVGPEQQPSGAGLRERLLAGELAAAGGLVQLGAQLLGDRAEHAQAPRDLGQPAGGGTDERDPGDALTDQLGVLLGEGHEGHPAHGVPGQHDRTRGGHVVQDREQVLPELLDGGPLGRRTARATVTALVVGDDPEVGAGGDERSDLVVPQAVGQHVAVGQHDGGGGVLGTTHLDVEQDTIVRRDRAGCTGRRTGVRRGRAVRPRGGAGPAPPGNEAGTEDCGDEQDGGLHTGSRAGVVARRSS